MRLSEETYVMLTRRNREGQSALYSASFLGLNVFGSTFQDLHEEIRRVRVDFHGSLVYSPRELCPRLVQGKPVNHDAVRECANRGSRTSGLLLLELAANLNVSVWYAYVPRYSKECERGGLHQNAVIEPRSFDTGDAYFPYGIYLMSYTSVRLIYVDDVNVRSSFNLRRTAAPFSFPLWLLLLAAIFTLSAVGGACLKDKGRRLEFIFSCLTALIFQVPCAFKRTALLALLWLLAVIVITNHYLALVQSITIMVVLSSAESEFHAASSACIDGVWLRELLHDLGFP